MKFVELKSFYIVSDIKEHMKNKMLLLSMINQMPHSNIENNNFESISKTDWNLDKNIERPYSKLFFEMIEDTLNDMAHKMKHNKLSVANFWYQIYGKGGHHEWHTHSKTQWTNIYYLHLENKKAVTELYDIQNEKILEQIEVKEGQLLTFSGNVIHRSPKNDSNLKAIISFNTNFGDTSLTI